MAAPIMTGEAFWTGTELSSTFSRRGTRLKEIRDLLKAHTTDRAVWSADDLDTLATAIATYARAKAWTGTGSIGERDKGNPAIITKLMAQVDAHLREQGLDTVRVRLGFVDVLPPIPPRPVPRAAPPVPTGVTTNRTPPPVPRTGPPITRPAPPLPITTSTVSPPSPIRRAPPLPAPTPSLTTTPPVTRRPPPPPSSTTTTVTNPPPVRLPPPPPRIDASSSSVTPPSPPRPAPRILTSRAPTSDEAIRLALKELDKAKEYGCRDAGTFWKCIRGYVGGDFPKPPTPEAVDGFVNAQRAPYKAIWLRYKSASGSVGAMGAVGATNDLNQAILRNARRQGIEAAVTDDPFEWNAERVKGGYEKVTSAKSGECTSFGVFAAHLLTTVDARVSPRVELVVWQGGPTVTHVYCIVNRDAAYIEESSPSGGKRYRLPPPRDWTGKWWVVDPWAASLGYESVYEQASGYPYTGMMDPLYLQMVYDD